MTRTSTKADHCAWSCPSLTDSVGRTCSCSLPDVCTVEFTGFCQTKSRHSQSTAREKRIDEGWSFYKVDIAVEPGSTHHYVFSIPTSPGAPELVSRPPLGSSCDVGEASYGFVAPSTCGGVLSLPAYEWQNGCACAGC